MTAHRSFLPVLSMLAALLLLPWQSSLAGSIPSLDLRQAIAGQDMARLRDLLMECGLVPEDIDDILIAESPVATELYAAHGYLIHAIDDGYGNATWLFFRHEHEHADQIMLMGFEQYRNAPAFLHAPEEVIAGRNNGLLFAVESTRASGSGVYLRAITWHFIEDDGPPMVHLVLTYPTEGYVSGWNMNYDRHFTGETLFSGLRHGVFCVDIEVTATYSLMDTGAPETDLELFTYTAPITFTFSPRGQMFLVDRNASQLTLEQLDGLFNDDTAGFLDHNLDRLLILAADGTPEQKRWLHDLASSVDGSAAARQLIQALAD